MEEKTAQELIHKGFEDMRRWIDEAETLDQLQYRLGVVSKVLSPQPFFHYYRDMSGTLAKSQDEEKNDQ